MPPAPRIAGDTFELPAPETTETPLANAAPSVDEGAEVAEAHPGDAPRETTPARQAHPAPRSSHEGRPSAGRAASGTGEPASAGSPAGLYGAVGERGAQDLESAFTRGFTQTASADPAWATAPLGPAGEADLAITIDETGHIVDVTVKGNPSAALRSSIRRSVDFVRGRTFVAHGKTTKLKLVARVTAGSGDDGLENDRFGLSVRNKKASFVLPIGRRIELDVR